MVREDERPQPLPLLGGGNDARPAVPGGSTSLVIDAPIGRTLSSRARRHDGQAEKLLPHPQPPVALGFLNVKPEPCIEVT